MRDASLSPLRLLPVCGTILCESFKLSPVISSPHSQSDQNSMIRLTGIDVVAEGVEKPVSVDRIENMMIRRDFCSENDELCLR